MIKMKKSTLLSIAIFGLFLVSFARPIDQETAKAIASKFLETYDLQLSATYTTSNNVAALYIFNTNDGFVIVSADDCETPIIGYSHEGRFDPNNIPVQMEGYLQDFVARIQYGIDNHITADELTARQWELARTTGRLTDNKSTQSVPALITSKWHQGCLYNSLCPPLTGPCDHAEVGCVAVAMAQIMRYWGYPETGWGSHSYMYYTGSPTLFVDFGHTTYDWEHMPDSLSESSSEAEIEAVATLLYHCGVSVDMRYGNNGSFASTGDVAKALRQYFGYSKQVHKEKKADYSNEEWSALLMNDLDMGRPIQYVGSGSGAHSFVCDGYDSEGLFHFNWGWGVANGYYALGNLNPIGYNFSNDNYALFDIFPHYDPCLVNATVFPANAGTLQGAGEYSYLEQCTLTATPAEGFDFRCWKRDGQIISNNMPLSIPVDEDTINIEAYFSCFPIGQITASYAPDDNNPNSPSVNLTWDRADTEWVLLKQFALGEEGSGVATDGEHVYVTYAEWNHPPFAFGKYTLDGDLVEQFNLRDDFDAVALDYDGTYFYCNTSHSGLQVLYRIDLDNRTIIDSTNISIWFGDITYDPEYDGFWLDRNYQSVLFDRQGQRIAAGPSLPDYIYGTGYYVARDGTSHLFSSRESGVYDYDIANDFIFDRPMLDPGWDYTYGIGACVAKYDGKDAMFVANDHDIRIYEIKSHLEHIIGYRIYRANSEGDTVMLADGIGGTTYLDDTWNEAVAGEYRFGISEVYANGVESEIIWSDTIVKTDYGINENGDDQPNGPSVQKVIENGHIVIIKDGMRYTITGQRLK